MPASSLQAVFRDYLRTKKTISCKQTMRQLSITMDQWVDMLAWTIDRGMAKESMEYAGEMHYAYVKPTADNVAHIKDTAVERTVVGVGSQAPKRGTPQGVTVRAARPKGAASQPGKRAQGIREGRVHKGRRGAK